MGYVGLPLAIEFAKKRSVIGFDTNKERVKELNSGIDKNLEFSKKEIQRSKLLIIKKNLNMQTATLSLYQHLLINLKDQI